MDAGDNSIVLSGRLSAGWFVTRVAFLVVVTPSVIWCIKVGTSVTVMFGFGSLVGLAWLAVDILRVSLAAEPRFVVTTREVRSACGVLGSLACIRRSDLSELQVVLSRHTLSFVAASGQRMNVPWRWIRVETPGDLELLEVGRLLRDRLSLPTNVAKGLRDKTMTIEPLV